MHTPFTDHFIRNTSTPSHLWTSPISQSHCSRAHCLKHLELQSAWLLVPEGGWIKSISQAGWSENHKTKSSQRSEENGRASAR